MSDDAVQVGRRGAVQIISIDRPQVRNALDAAVARLVAGAVDELDASDELRAGVLTGLGGFLSAGWTQGSTAFAERRPLVWRGR